MEPSDVIDTLIEIGNKRRQIFSRMREAVLAENLVAVFKCAQQLVGLAEAEEKTAPTPQFRIKFGNDLLRDEIEQTKKKAS